MELPSSSVKRALSEEKEKCWLVDKGLAKDLPTHRTGRKKRKENIIKKGSQV